MTNRQTADELKKLAVYYHSKNSTAPDLSIADFLLLTVADESSNSLTQSLIYIMYA